MSTNLKTLIGKLNDPSREAMSRAANMCVHLGHYEIEIEHYFLALLECAGNDLAAIGKACRVDLTQLAQDLQRELGKLRTGNNRTPVFSPHLEELLQHAWMIASLERGGGRIRGGHILLALLAEPRLVQLAMGASGQFGRFAVDRIRHDLDGLTRGSIEAQDAQPAPAAPSAPAGDAAPGTPRLDQYTVNLTQLAREGRIDPVIGRDAEIRQTVDILMRRRQNNPILTGEAGVGKTAVVEGLALRIAAGDVPDCLCEVDVRSLDLGLLQAGASVKGEFEQRLKGVIDEVARSAGKVVLFIDEAHTIIGAGGQAGQGDAANLLKPALARGQLRTIAATTWSEYKKYFEKDAALARRFQVVKVEEPSEAVACAMLRAMVPLMETHFAVRIVDAAVTEAVRLSHRYISGRQLPDKAVSLLDTACSRVALGRRGTPALLEDAVRRGEALACEIAALEREWQETGAHAERLDTLKTLAVQCDQEQQACRARWAQEQAAIEAIMACRRQPGAPGSAEALAAATARLRALQGEAPMLPLEVDGAMVARIVAGWTGIPVGAMLRDEIRTVLDLRALLERRVLGQPHAIDSVAQRVQMARADLDDPGKPRAVFLFVGPSGTGKTETALALADLLYGGEQKLVTINLSEFQEAHSVSGLKGSPPGYVGYGEGGVLTEAVRRNPYSVVLLDEIEKAHPDVLELFYQVFDKGVLDDAEGRPVDFRNTVIIATSNVASAVTMQACLAGPRPDPGQLAALIRPHLSRQFKPAFLARLHVVPFYPIGDEALGRIVALKLDRIAQRVRANHDAAFTYDEALVDAIYARCTDADAGARNVDHVIHDHLLPEVARTVLERMAEGRPVGAIAATADEGGFRFTFA